MATIRTIQTSDGPDLQQIILEQGDQSVTLLSYGGTTQDWRLNDNGVDIPLILGHSDARRYQDNRGYHGVIAGRVANRIGGAEFSLGGKTHRLQANDGHNTLHGGANGLSRRHFAVDVDSASNTVRFTYRSADGEEGFPGTVDFTYDISLQNGQLIYDLGATTDRPTPINLAQHNSYNLMGEGDIWGHKLQVLADRYTPGDDDLIPSGVVAPVPGWLDYQKPALIEADPERHGTTDHNLILRDGLDRATSVAQLSAPNGVTLRMWSDQPAIQMYSCHGLAPQHGANETPGAQPYYGVCLEPQHFPDAVNKPDFAGIIATPDVPYRQRLMLDILKG